MTLTTDMLHGLAQMINDASVATWRSDGSAYLPTETAVYFAWMPPGNEATPPAPDRCVVLTAYGVGDNAGRPWLSQRLQVRFRGLIGRPDDTWTLRDQVYDLWQSAHALQFGAVAATQILRLSSIPMGRDGNQRFEIADNYAIDLDVPATANRTA